MYKWDGSYSFRCSSTLVQHTNGKKKRDPLFSIGCLVYGAIYSLINFKGEASRTPVRVILQSAEHPRIVIFEFWLSSLWVLKGALQFFFARLSKGISIGVTACARCLSAGLHALSATLSLAKSTRCDRGVGRLLIMYRGDSALHSVLNPWTMAILRSGLGLWCNRRVDSDRNLALKTVHVWNLRSVLCGWEPMFTS